MRSALDTWLFAALLVLIVVIGGRVWLNEHPEHDPWAPLSLDDDPEGWATARKVAALRGDADECRAFLRRSAIDFTPLPPVGAGECRRDDRQTLAADEDMGLVLRPSGAQATCSIGAGLALWLRHGVQPAAEALLGSRVVSLEHYGTNNCRRIGSGDTGRWSEHATGNAIDIAAFLLADGRRIVVRRDWAGDGDAATFLHAVRDTACRSFATVLSPDYNAAHADHLHLDQAQRSFTGSYCR